MKELIFIILAISLFVDTARAEGVTLKTAPSAGGSQITFGDLFVGDALPASLVNVVIGPAPRPGRRSSIEAKWLEATAQRYGITWQKPEGLTTVIISRAGQPVPQEHIRATIAEALKAKATLAAVILDIEPADIWIPSSSEPSVAIETLDYNQATGNFTARVSAPADDGEIFAVYGRATPAKPVATLTRDIAAGQVLSADDVSEQPIEIGRAAQDSITDVSAIVGLATKRQMRAGQKLRQADLERPRMLKKGDVVTLIYEVPGMSLTALGRAVSDGAAGDVISIVNSQSHRTVEAKVTSAGTAIVESRATPEQKPQSSLASGDGAR
jgi:flagellar basal body P-ring formation protein FlgA